MSKILIVHNYLPGIVASARVRDAFSEADHPRASNGQFGAGAGKSHAEHAAHHEAQSTKHLENVKAEGSRSGMPGTHGAASRAHAKAGSMHRTAVQHEEQYGSTGKIGFDAHQQSKAAHEASQAAGGGTKDPREAKLAAAKANGEHIQVNRHRVQAAEHNRSMEEHADANAAHLENDNHHAAEMHGIAYQAHQDAHEKHKVAVADPKHRAEADRLSNVAKAASNRASMAED